MKQDHIIERYDNQWNPQVLHIQKSVWDAKTAMLRNTLLG